MLPKIDPDPAAIMTREVENACITGAVEGAGTAAATAAAGGRLIWARELPRVL